MQTWREGLTDTARAATGECLNAVKGESGDDGMAHTGGRTNGPPSLSERCCRCKLNAVKHLECVRVKRGIRASEQGRRRNNVFLRMKGDRPSPSSIGEIRVCSSTMEEGMTAAAAESRMTVQ